jgi:exodeoxyribonuclease VII small subunit
LTRREGLVNLAKNRKEIHLPKKTTKSPDFEQALAELENLVQRLEQGDTSLEQSLQDFERGIELTRTCQQALKQAEQKIQILLQDNEQAPLETFDSDD